VVARIGERGALLLGALGGAAGFTLYGLAPNGWAYIGSAPVFAVMSFLQPGLQGLMTRRVGPQNQGQLQGANQSLQGIASVVGTPFRPAFRALMPSLVTRPEELTASNGTSSTLESLSFFAGPAIAGVLLATTSVPVVLLFDAATFAWSALLISGVHSSQPGRAPTTSEDGVENGIRDLVGDLVRVAFGDRFRRERE